MAQKIVAGNWKMNLSLKEAIDLVESIDQEDLDKDVRVILFPSTLYLQALSEKTKLELGVQNFSEMDKGAYTGEIAISQIRSVGGSIGLIGHSERRMYYKESNDVLKAKVNQAVEEDFDFIFCCGEPLEVREGGREMEYVSRQLKESLFHLPKDKIKNKIIAYEPVWAIGTGKTATAEQAEEMHKNIRFWLKEKYGEEIADSVSILYGGSCKPQNAKEIFACENVDGGLIGGASLNAKDFTTIINSFE